MKKIHDLRQLIDYLKAKNDILVIEKEIDPIYEMSGLMKSLDGGPVLLFTNVKGYHGHSVIANIFSDRARIAELFDAEDEYLAKRLAEAIKSPIAPKEVNVAPCQENIIAENIDLLNKMPVPKTTEEDAGRIITGGIVMAKIPNSDQFNLSYHRMNVIGKDYTSIAIQAGRHLLEIIKKGERYPVTVNIGCNPATLLAASGATQQSITPFGYNEMGFAGSLQRAPVEFVKAKVQEGAWSIADAEWVLEGYIDAGQYVAEEEHGDMGKRLFMPEAGGYMGRAWKTFKFQVTAVTHRNNPIYFYPIGGAFETTNLMGLAGEASVYDICKRIDARVFDTCYALPGMRGIFGIVIRVNKQYARDEGVQNNLMLGAMAGHSDLGWVIVVDKDIDVKDANEVLWAMITRMYPHKDIMVTPMARVSGMLSESTTAGIAHKVGFDATYFIEDRHRYTRSNFPKCDVTKWLSDDQLKQVRLKQSDYAKSLARRRR
jgi:4-hydroxy-3-polyprenylbenzoate decarboxylase